MLRPVLQEGREGKHSHPVALIVALSKDKGSNSGGWEQRDAGAERGWERGVKAPSRLSGEG